LAANRWRDHLEAVDHYEALLWMRELAATTTPLMSTLYPKGTGGSPSKVKRKSLGFIAATRGGSRARQLSYPIPPKFQNSWRNLVGG
jgi:hypothetical protein